MTITRVEAENVLLGKVKPPSSLTSHDNVELGKIMLSPKGEIGLAVHQTI
jgi:hypothetical protein